MPNRALDRGKRGEREAAHLLYALLGYQMRRSQAGHPEDLGDLFGLPNTTVQVADWKDVLRAVRVKPLQAEAQRRGNKHRWIATLIRLRGGSWRVVLTPEQFAELWSAATADERFGVHVPTQEKEEER